MVCFYGNPRTSHGGFCRVDFPASHADFPEGKKGFQHQIYEGKDALTKKHGLGYESVNNLTTDDDGWLMINPNEKGLKQQIMLLRIGELEKNW